MKPIYICLFLIFILGDSVSGRRLRTTKRKTKTTKPLGEAKYPLNPYPIVTYDSKYYKNGYFTFDQLHVEEYEIKGDEHVSIRSKKDNKHEHCSGKLTSKLEPFDSSYLEKMKQGNIPDSDEYGPYSGMFLETDGPEYCLAFKSFPLLDDIWKFIPGVPSDIKTNELLPEVSVSKGFKELCYEDNSKGHHYTIPFENIVKKEYVNHWVGRDSVKITLKSPLKGTENRRLVLTFVLNSNFNKEEPSKKLFDLNLNEMSKSR